MHHKKLWPDLRYGDLRLNPGRISGVPYAGHKEELESVIAQEPEDSDAAAMAANDLVYLRLCKNDLKQKAKQINFSNGAFSTDGGFINLDDM